MPEEARATWSLFSASAPQNHFGGSKKSRDLTAPVEEFLKTFSYLFCFLQLHNLFNDAASYAQDDGVAADAS